MRLLLAVFLLTSALPAQDIPCQSTVALAKQHRTNVKHRAVPATPQVTTGTPATVLTWATPTNLNTPAARKMDVPFPTRELKVYKITGDVWRVKVEDNDCDFHVEMSAVGKPKTSPRVIVEIPQGDEYKAARDAVIEMLVNNGYGVTGTQDLEEPIKATVTGYAFYDTAHWSKKNPKKGHGHGTKYVGTLWELHPVWSFKEAAN